MSGGAEWFQAAPNRRRALVTTWIKSRRDIQFYVGDEARASGPVGWFEHLSQVSNQPHTFSKPGAIGLGRGVRHQVKEIALPHLLDESAEGSTSRGQICPRLLKLFRSFDRKG